MNKKQMNDEITKKLGYELLPAYYAFSYSEMKYIYDSIVKYDYDVVYIDNHVYIQPKRYA